MEESQKPKDEIRNTKKFCPVDPKCGMENSMFNYMGKHINVIRFK
jgi:hypothetical protein